MGCGFQDGGQFPVHSPRSSPPEARDPSEVTRDFQSEWGARERESRQDSQPCSQDLGNNSTRFVCDCYRPHVHLENVSLFLCRVTDVPSASLVCFRPSLQRKGLFSISIFWVMGLCFLGLFKYVPSSDLFGLVWFGRTKREFRKRVSFRGPESGP